MICAIVLAGAASLAAGDARAGCPHKDSDLSNAVSVALTGLENELLQKTNQQAVCRAIAILIAAETRLLRYWETNQVLCTVDIAYIEAAQSNLRRAQSYRQTLGAGCGVQENPTPLVLPRG